MTVPFTAHAQSKINALSPSTRPHVVPQILAAYETPQISYGDSRNDDIEHRVYGDYAILVSRVTGKVVTFHLHGVETATRGDEGKRRKLSYRERHLAAQKGNR